MAESLVDTNVFSRVFTGDKAVKEFIETLHAAVCNVVYVECLQVQNQTAKSESSKVISLDLSFVT